MRLPIDRDFMGKLLPEHERASVDVHVDGEMLCVDVDAPYHADPAPAASVGACDRLWEHEVVELFLADAGDHYLEIELGPHGHHLVLELRGVRTVVRSCLPIEYAVTIKNGRFAGHARVPTSYLSMQVTRANAYAIHGVGAARVYHAHSPVLAAAPDFHRLECFVPIEL